MSKEIRMAPKKPEPRTWGFPENSQPLVGALLARRIKGNQRLIRFFAWLEKQATARFSKKIVRYQPELRGKNVQLKFNRDGKPYAEEVL